MSRNVSREKSTAPRGGHQAAGVAAGSPLGAFYADSWCPGRPRDGGSEQR